MDSMQVIERDDTLARLREVIPTGSTVHLILRHVSRSGLRRVISTIVVTHYGDIRDVSDDVACALGWKQNRNRSGGIVVDGVGLDMGFHLIYSLSRELHGDGCALHHRWL